MCEANDKSRKASNQLVFSSLYIFWRSNPSANLNTNMKIHYWHSDRHIRNAELKQRTQQHQQEWRRDVTLMSNFHFRHICLCLWTKVTEQRKKLWKGRVSETTCKRARERERWGWVEREKKRERGGRSAITAWPGCKINITIKTCKCSMGWVWMFTDYPRVLTSHTLHVNTCGPGLQGAAVTSARGG